MKMCSRHGGLSPATKNPKSSTSAVPFLSRFRSNARWVSWVALSALVLLTGLEAQGKYHVKQKFTLGGEGGWDYLTWDPAGKRLFISRGTRVIVFDPYKGTTLGEIPGTPGVHGIALAPDLGKGYTSNGGDNTVTVFDLKTLKTITTLKIEGQVPDAILYEPVSHRVLTFNARSHNATVINALNDEVAGAVALSGKPEFAVSDEKGMVYVNIEDKGELTKLDPVKATAVQTWPLAPCESPTGLAMDHKARRLFSVCRNKMMAVVNADSGKVVTTLPIGQGVDGSAYDPAAKLAFASNGDGTLTVVRQDSADKYEVEETAETMKFARTLTLNPATHEVFLVTAEIEMVPNGEGKRPRRTVKPGTFTVMVVGR